MRLVTANQSALFQRSIVTQLKNFLMTTARSGDPMIPSAFTNIQSPLILQI